MSITTIVIIVLALVVLWVVAVYNRFIRLRNRAKEAWSDISVQLKRRYDLIPNLINTVKGYASHEEKVLSKVTEMRAKAIEAKSVTEHAQAENMLTQALRSIFAVAENYPDLKANQNFLELQRELSDTENKIQAARRFYNTNVRDLNIGIESFPGNVVAGIFGFKRESFFELEESGAKEPINVSF